MGNILKPFISSPVILNVPISIALICLISIAPVEIRGSSKSSEEIYFTVLHTNDLHSALIPHSPAVDYRPEEPGPATGGFARLGSAISEIRKQKSSIGEPVLLFDGGDFLGGSAFGWLSTRGHAPELTLMQEMGYDAVVIGNHEYDYGPDVLANYLIAAGYPEAHSQTLVLASNTTAPENHSLSSKDLYRNSGMIELENGIKVGVFGLIGKDAISVAADTGDFEFTDQHEAAKKYTGLLKERNADIIIALTHSGLEEDRKLARAVPGIDIIVGGHCHTAIYQPVHENNTIIAQAGSLGGYLGKLELAYNPETNKLRLRNTGEEKPALLGIDDNLPDQPEIDSLVKEYTLVLNDYVACSTGGLIDDILHPVASSDFPLANYPPLQETPVGNFITDAMRLVTQEITGQKVDVAIQANGSIRQNIQPGSMEHSKGMISFYEIVETIGLGYGADGNAGYPIVSVYLTGEEVRRLLEVAVLLQELLGDTFFLQFSGLRYSYNPTNALYLTVPFIDLPVPTTRAVTNAEFYTGNGFQPCGEGDYKPIEAGDETLYHMVADTYILSYLPMVGDLLPQLEIIPKNAMGEPVAIEDHSELVVHHDDGSELKVWQTVVNYAASQPAGAAGIPQLPAYYENTAGRINQAWSFPLIAWPALILVAGVTAILLFIRWRRNRNHYRA